MARYIAATKLVLTRFYADCPTLFLDKLDAHKKILLPLLLILLTGCTTLPKYNYQSQSSADPSFIFGDRFGGGAVHGAARTFAVNTKDAAANKCADFSVVGATSNNWIKLSPPTIEIKTPADKAISIRGSYLYGTTSCLPPVLIFIPKAGAQHCAKITEWTAREG